MKFINEVIVRILEFFLSLGTRVTFIVTTFLSLLFQIGYFFLHLIYRILSLISFKLIGVTTLLLLLVISSYVYVRFMLTIPNPKALGDFARPAPILIYDRNNVILYSAYSQHESESLRYADIPPLLIKAILAQEDNRFYQHKGFNLLRNFFQVKPTITQKLAKNFFLGEEKNIRNKLREIVLTMRLEQNFTKIQLLEIYLHTRSFANAARLFFNKSVSDLNDAESLFLASKRNDNVSDKEEIENLVDQMVRFKMIPRGQKTAIMSQSYAVQPHSTYKRAPLVVEYVLEKLEKEYGKEYVQRNGAVVKTTIDIVVQNNIQKRLIEKTLVNNEYGPTSAAVLVTTQNDGNVLAMTASDQTHDLNSDQLFTSYASRLNQETMLTPRIVNALFDYRGNPLPEKKYANTSLKNDIKGPLTLAVYPTIVIGVWSRDKQLNPDGLNTFLQEVLALSEQNNKAITQMTR